MKGAVCASEATAETDQACLGSRTFIFTDLSCCLMDVHDYQEWGSPYGCVEYVTDRKMGNGDLIAIL